MKSMIMWDVTPCSLIDVYGRFKGTSCLHLHGRISSETSSKHFVCCFIAWLSSSTTMKIEAIYSTETVYQAIWRHFGQNSSMHLSSPCDKYMSLLCLNVIVPIIMK
jgi:hypothetical protein